MVVSSRSSTTTSGLCWRTSLTTSVPSVVQAATVMSGSPSSSARRPSTTMAWSSARSTRIIPRDSLAGERDGEGRAPPGRAVDGERATQHLDPVLDPAQPEVPAFDPDALLAREHVLRVESPAVVRYRQRDGSTAARDGDALARGARVAVAVGERLLEDAVDRDLRRQDAVAEVGRQVELDPLVGQRFVLHGEPLDDLSEGAPLEARGAERPDEIADLTERALEQPHGLRGALLGRRVGAERALEHLELGQGGEEVLHRSVVHVEHDPLQLPLARREEASRSGADLSVPGLRHGPRRRPPSRSTPAGPGDRPAPRTRDCAPRPAARTPARRGRRGTATCPTATRSRGGAARRGRRPRCCRSSCTRPRSRSRSPTASAGYRPSRSRRRRGGEKRRAPTCATAACGGRGSCPAGG